MNQDDIDRELRLEFIGSFLRKRRVQTDLTQWDVARELGYTTAQFVSNWERGVSLPPFDTLPALSKLLRIPADELVEVMVGYQEQLLKQYSERLNETLGIAGRRKKRSAR